MSGMKDGFKRGTHMHYRMRMAGRAAAEQAAIRAWIVDTAVKVMPEMLCKRCGHQAAEHDMDRTVLMPGQEIGGEGCLHDVTSRAAGCECDQFEIPTPAKGMR